MHEGLSHRTVPNVGSSWNSAASLLAAFVLVAAGLACGPLAWAQEKTGKPAGPSLYKRLGGYDEIASIVDDFLTGLGKDPTFARFGTGRGQDSKMRARQLIVDQICSLSGGPCFYIGREMKSAHYGLAITDQEWEASGKIMGEVLAKHKIPEKEQQELGGIIESLQKDIVEQPAQKK